MRTKKVRYAIAFIMTLIMVFSMVFNNVSYAITLLDENNENDLRIHYEFNELSVTDKSTIIDSSGNGNNGILKGNGASIEEGVLTLPGGKGGSKAAFVEFPEGVFDNQNTLTISIWLKNETGAGNYSAMFFGTREAPPAQYWLLNPCSPGGNYKSVFTDSYSASAPWNNEKGVFTGQKTDGNWALYTTVITPKTESENGSITAYYNGKFVGREVLTRNVSDFGKDLVGYIGKSSYQSDIFYKGSIKDVKVYSSALSDLDIKEEYYNNMDEGDIDTALLEDMEGLSFNKTDIISNITLQTRGIKNGSRITWVSDNEDYITNNGEVTRPINENKEVTLTATLSLAGRSMEKDFNLTVLSDDPKNDANELASNLILNGNHVTDNIILPTTAGKDSTITWMSSNEGYITSEGVVTRPNIGEGNREVKLTAEVLYNGAKVTKEFIVTVIEEYYGYLMSYILEGNQAINNSLHLAYSMDGKEFIALNSNTGISFAKNSSTSQSYNPNGFKSPFIFRKDDGTYGLIATNNDNSSYVYVLESKDLINFTNETTLMLNNSGIKVLNPECSYDTTTGEYIISWTDGNKTYKNTTKDFIKASSPIEGTHEFSTNNATVLPENAIQSKIFNVTKDEYTKVVNKLAPVVNTGVEKVSVETLVGENIELPKQVIGNYNDGSTSSVPVEWNKDDIEKINIDEPGTYEVSGIVERKEYPNPFIEERADPWILKASDGYYYFTASYPQKGYSDKEGYSKVTLRRSLTIDGLIDAEEVSIWDAYKSNGIYRNIWAPEIHEINGKLYVYYTGSIDRNNVFGIRPHVLECIDRNDPMNPNSWIERGAFKTTDDDKFSFSNFSLDMTYFENNGEHYVIWAQNAPISKMYMAKVDPDSPWKLTSKAMELTTPEYSWERQVYNVNEGPAVLKKNGKVFVCFSAAGVGPEYSIGILSADEDSDLMELSSWTKTPYPILTSADVPGEYGPGHNSFTVDEYGNDVFVYHARSQECYEGKCEWAGLDALADPCRHARVKNVHWAADGTPILKMTSDQAISETNKNIIATIVVSEVVKETQEAPKNLIGLEPTSKNGSDGKITGVTTEMEYSNTELGEYTVCEGNEIDGLVAGEYYVRYSETDTKYASNTIKVIVPEYEDNEKPIVVSKVTNLKGVESNNTVKLTWDEPEDKNGLVEYIIYKDGKELTRVPLGSSEYLVSSLKFNTIYGFKVTTRYSNEKISKPVSINIRTEKNKSILDYFR